MDRIKAYLIVPIGLTLAGLGHAQSATGIAYTSLVEGTGFRIHVMDPDGSNQRQLTDAAIDLSNSDDFNIAWSPDGSQIAFSLKESEWPDIFLIDADGTNLTNLTKDPDTLDRNPAWSPDGSQIAFDSRTREFRAKTDIYTIDVDGSNRMQLTDDPATDGSPTWSPDGKQIAFQSKRAGDTSQIFVMAADGSDQIQLTNGAMSCAAADWSPDGSRIAYTGDGTRINIFVVNLDGTNQVNLTGYPAQTSFDYNFTPSWSPDGSKIAFVSTRDRGYEGWQADMDTDIFVIGLDGTEPVNITNSPTTSETQPSWSPIPSGISTVIEAISWGLFKANYR